MHVGFIVPILLINLGEKKKTIYHKVTTPENVYSNVYSRDFILMRLSGLLILRILLYCSIRWVLLFRLLIFQIFENPMDISIVPCWSDSQIFKESAIDIKMPINITTPAKPTLTMTIIRGYYD